MDALYPHGLRQHRRPRRCAQGHRTAEKMRYEARKDVFLCAGPGGGRRAGPHRRTGRAGMSALCTAVPRF